MRLNSRLLALYVAAFAVFVLLGRFWGDPWGTTVLRGLAMAVTLAAISYVYAAHDLLRRVARVTAGVVVGGLAAQSVGASIGVVAVTSLVFGGVLLACEYLIQRDLRRSTASGI